MNAGPIPSGTGRDSLSAEDTGGLRQSSFSPVKSFDFGLAKNVLSGEARCYEDHALKTVVIVSPNSSVYALHISLPQSPFPGLYSVLGKVRSGEIGATELPQELRNLNISLEDLSLIATPKHSHKGLQLAEKVFLDNMSSCINTWSRQEIKSRATETGRFLESGQMASTHKSMYIEYPESHAGRVKNAIVNLSREMRRPHDREQLARQFFKECGLTSFEHFTFKL